MRYEMLWVSDSDSWFKEVDYYFGLHEVQFSHQCIFCLGLIKLSFSQRKDTIHVIYERELLQV